MPYDYVMVDAFAREPLYGNPAAVVFDADDMPASTMQRIARELNLSETMFVLKPSSAQAHYRVRIFTPQSELPFAGHPTVAAAHAMRLRDEALARLPLLRQECGIGIIPVEVSGGNSLDKLLGNVLGEAAKTQTDYGLEQALGDGAPQTATVLTMTQAVATYRDAALTREAVAQMLRCADSDLADLPFEVVSTGAPWLIVGMATLSALAGLAPNLDLIEQVCRNLRATGVTVFAERGDEGPVRLRLRTFAPGEGIAEDPVCGSGNGSVAAYLARHVHVGEQTGAYRAEQGVELGRNGAIHASWSRDADSVCVRIGGEAVVCAGGRLHL